MIVATWKYTGMFKGDAQRVAEEIKSIGEEATPDQVLEKAKDDATELHKCFEWDDAVAADKYRLEQARQILRFLVVQEETKSEDRPPIRVFYKLGTGEGYKPVEYVVKKEDEYQQLLKRAWGELRSFKAKYSMLSELQEILSLID